MTWQAGGETTTRGYKFTYDGLNRMLDAIYGEGTNIGSNANRFTEKVTGYDKNGNILALQRYGQTSASGYGLIDNLTFTLNGNQLNRVDDAVTASAYNNGFEFKDAVKQENEYAYDANGNLTKDLNKNISEIQYNCLNLPRKVTFTDGSTIEYTYAADGTKLRTKHVINGTTTTTDYCGNVIYENGVQKLLLTEAGYLTLADSKYHYYLQDHQGNNRVVIDQNGTVEETNHYYPFGGVFANSTSVQPYKYNGKELDTKKGLNWYDYGARHYDAAIGRFATVDPMAEKYYSMSPYAYCGNSPIKFIDIDGRKIVDPFGKEITYENGVWSSNVTADVKQVGEAMMRNEVGMKQFQTMLSVEHPITIDLVKGIDKGIGYYGGTRVKGVKGEKINSAQIKIYVDAIQDLVSILPIAKHGEVVMRYRENTDVNSIDFEDVMGAIATHESVHATDTDANVIGNSVDKEAKPIEKEIEYIRAIKNRK